MRINIISGTDPLMTVVVEPRGSVTVETTRLLRSSELRRALALAIATLAEQRQWLAREATDIATVDISAWLSMLARRPRRRRLRA